LSLPLHLLSITKTLLVRNLGFTFLTYLKLISCSFLEMTFIGLVLSKDVRDTLTIIMLTYNIYIYILKIRKGTYYKTHEALNFSGEIKQINFLFIDGHIRRSYLLIW
jgi:prepilin-type processing-associated H-X9-DG protein